MSDCCTLSLMSKYYIFQEDKLWTAWAMTMKIIRRVNTKNEESLSSLKHHCHDWGAGDNGLKVE